MNLEEAKKISVEISKDKEAKIVKALFGDGSNLKAEKRLDSKNNQ